MIPEPHSDIPVKRITGDKVALCILMEYGFHPERPLLASQLSEAIGEGFDEAFDGLIRRGDLVPVFPEATAETSGRQFWVVRGYAA